MLAEIGFVATILALLTAIYTIAASVYGEIRGDERMVLSGRNAAFVNFALLSLATGILQYALMTQEYQIAYVWSVSSPSMPEFFRATALWGSQAGSLLFWTWLMAGFVAAATLLNWRSHRRLMPYTIAFMMAVILFFVFILLVFENPFERWWIDTATRDTIRSALIPAGAQAPSQASLAESANGLNPMLRHFGMAIHPPMLYLGFVGFIVPYAFAMAALASGDLSTNWIKASRRWALLAWLFLSLGLILGGRWAYDVLGWGGYWGWDPVENAAFLPWLIGTAYLHSVMIQEKRGMFKLWNMFLVIGTFSLIIFGTFATRSGLIESVHSFAQSDIGFPMFFFWATLTIISVGLIMWRYNQGYLRDDRQLVNLFSRETIFVLNNFVFVALTAVIFWGSFGGPIVSELFFNTEITHGTDYFMRTTPPLFALLYILMGIAPLSAWGATSFKRLGNALAIPFALTLASLVLFIIAGMASPVALFAYAVVTLAGWVAVLETYRGVMARMRAHGENPAVALLTMFGRNPRRYGGYMIHVGVVIIGLGVIGSTLFQAETQQTLAIGESLTIQDYELRYDNLRSGQVAQDGRILDIADVTVFRDGREIAQLSPRRDWFVEGTGTNSMTIAGSHSTIENDFYVLLVGWEEIGAGAATFKVYINPLVNLVWWGGLILIAGTIFAVWPKEILPARIRERANAIEPDDGTKAGAKA